MEREKQGGSGLFKGDYFESVLVETRYIDSRIPDTSFDIYGEKFASPIMIPAFSHLDDMHHKADMVEVVKGTQKAGAVCWVDTEEKQRLTDIADTNAGIIKIIKPYADNKIIISQIEEAQECGVLAVGLDLSFAFDDKGGCNRLQGADMGPKTMEEIREFVSAASVPFIVKGILSERDAYKCMMADVKGIVVSGYHSIRNCVIPPPLALPDVLKTVNAQIPVFVDCEIANGQNAFKVLAMGASAVFADRAFMASLVGENAEDICERINNMNDELKGLMARTGCYNLSHMDKTVLRQI